MEADPEDAMSDGGVSNPSDGGCSDSEAGSKFLNGFIIQCFYMGLSKVSKSDCFHLSAPSFTIPLPGDLPWLQPEGDPQASPTHWQFYGCSQLHGEAR